MFCSLAGSFAKKRLMSGIFSYKNIAFTKPSQNLGFEG